jgi:hypothetical protein
MTLAEIIAIATAILALLFAVSAARAAAQAKSLATPAAQDWIDRQARDATAERRTAA